MINAITCNARAAVLFALFLMLIAGVAGVQAEIYKWVDADGRIQFSDRPSPDGRSEDVRLRPINTYQGVSVEEYVEMGSIRPKEAKARKVVMYSTPWCGVCKRAKRFFQSKGIPFRELDIEKNRMARREFDRMNAKGVPVILVGGKRMNGFSEKRFMDLYRM